MIESGLKIEWAPSPAFERYRREARRRDRHARVRLWWEVNRGNIVALSIGVAWAVVVVAGAVTAQQLQQRRDADARALAVVQQNERLTHLVSRLVQDPRGRLQVRISADGPDDAIAVLDQLRGVLVAERGAAQ